MHARSPSAIIVPDAMPRAQRRGLVDAASASVVTWVGPLVLQGGRNATNAGRRCKANGV
jgi:hypothetical protein